MSKYNLTFHNHWKISNILVGNYNHLDKEAYK